MTPRPALLAGALEKGVVERISPAPFVRDALPELRRRRLGIFQEPWANYVGFQLDPYAKRDDSACRGFLDTLKAVPAFGGPAYRFDGWAYLKGVKGGVRRASCSSIIWESSAATASAATTGPTCPAPSRSIHARDTGFVGHVGRPREDVTTLTAFALTDYGHTACKLNGALDLDREAARRLVVP